MNATQAEETLARQSAIVAVIHYGDMRERESFAKTSKEGAAIVIKRWLDQHPGEELKDGETGWSAFWKPGTGPGDFDWQRCPPEIIVALARAGCFKTESKEALALIGKKNKEVGAWLDRWHIPGGETKSLSVVNKF